MNTFQPNALNNLFKEVYKDYFDNVKVNNIGELLSKNHQWTSSYYLYTDIFCDDL